MDWSTPKWAIPLSLCELFYPMRGIYLIFCEFSAYHPVSYYPVSYCGMPLPLATPCEAMLITYKLVPRTAVGCREGIPAWIHAAGEVFPRGNRLHVRRTYPPHHSFFSLLGASVRDDDRSHCNQRWDYLNIPRHQVSGVDFVVFCFPLDATEGTSCSVEALLYFLCQHWRSQGLIRWCSGLGAAVSSIGALLVPGNIGPPRRTHKTWYEQYFAPYCNAVVTPSLNNVEHRLVHAGHLYTR